MKRLALALTAFLWCICSQATELLLSSQGYGPVLFGTRLLSVPSHLGAATELSELKDPSCHYVAFHSLPGVAFMVENGIVTRADASEHIANTLGIKVGAKLGNIRGRYPRLQIRPHQYDPGGHYLIFAGNNRRTAIVMEEINGVVAAIRAGLKPSAEYTEGCL